MCTDLLKGEVGWSKIIYWKIFAEKILSFKTWRIVSLIEELSVARFNGLFIVLTLCDSQHPKLIHYPMKQR